MFSSIHGTGDRNTHFTEAHISPKCVSLVFIFNVSFALYAFFDVHSPFISANPTSMSHCRIYNCLNSILYNFKHALLDIIILECERYSTYPVKCLTLIFQISFANLT